MFQIQRTFMMLKETHYLILIVEQMITWKLSFLSEAHIVTSVWSPWGGQVYSSDSGVTGKAFYLAAKHNNT